MFQRSFLASSRALAARPAAPAMFRYFSASAALESKALFVANLPYEATQEQLEAKFAQFGNLEEVRIAMSATGQPRGFGFVTYSEEQELGKTGDSVGEEAIQALGEQDFMGRPMLVKASEKREPRDNRNGSSRGGGFGRSDGGFGGRGNGGYGGRSEGGYGGRSEGGYGGRGRGGSSFRGRGNGGARRGGGGYGGHDNGGYTGDASF